MLNMEIKHTYILSKKFLNAQLRSGIGIRQMRSGLEQETNKRQKLKFECNLFFVFKFEFIFKLN